MNTQVVEPVRNQALARRQYARANGVTGWVPYIAEGIGTFALVFAGCGAIMIDKLSGSQVTHVGVALAFGLVITVMIYALGRISGAHFNPAVALGFMLARHFPLRRLAGYWTAQLAGAVLASLFLRFLLGDVAHLGATVPAGRGGGILDLLPHVCDHGDGDRHVGGGTGSGHRHRRDRGTQTALFAVPISGASMNPARSLGPALISWTWTAKSGLSIRAAAWCCGWCFRVSLAAPDQRPQGKARA